MKVVSSTRFVSTLNPSSSLATALDANVQFRWSWKGKTPVLICGPR